ncbi:MAG: type II secretion system protein [Planctomycetota bacterium]
MTSVTPKHNTIRAFRQGFTLIELLVVISVIVLLIGILLPVLGSARNAASNTIVLNNLRQTSAAYQAYQLDFSEWVLLGFTPATLEGEIVEVTTSNGLTLGIPWSERYPWRLERYFNGVWETLFYPNDVPDGVPSDLYLRSLEPVLGLNSIYVGGHAGVGEGFVNSPKGLTPNLGAHIVFRTDEVRNPSQLITFTEVLQRLGTDTAGSVPDAGYFFTAPPRAAGGVVWTANGPNEIDMNPGGNVGMPYGRFADAIPTAFFDGHVEMMSAVELEDMRLWANWADTPDYNY